MRDPRIDDYIANSGVFARPILRHLRATVHEACPEVEETLKWNFPCFMYRGMLCSMASFKGHVAFGFWKGSLVIGKDKRTPAEQPAMGQFGRITKLSELPSKVVLTGYIRRAMKLNERGVNAPRKRVRPQVTPLVPGYFLAALRKNGKVRGAFDRLSPSHRREYIEWMEEAKSEETRSRRLASALTWIAEGKSRNWKYESRG